MQPDDSGFCCATVMKKRKRDLSSRASTFQYGTSTVVGKERTALDSLTYVG